MKYIAIIFIIFSILLFNGCIIPQEIYSIESVEIDQKSIPLNAVLLDEFDLSSIKLIVTKSDGTKQLIAVELTMLSVADQQKLTTVGEKTIEVEYEAFKVSFTISLFEKLQYTVIFKGMDGVIIKTEYVDKGVGAQAPIAPEVKGYTFIGWDGDYSHITKDTVVNAKYEKSQKVDDYLSISEVKKVIDQGEEPGISVKFVGKVIGFDSMGYAHLADDTGSIYIRATHPLLVLDANVVINGIGFIYRGSVGYPEYTRQIKAEGLEVFPYDELISILQPQVLSPNDLEVSDDFDYQNAFFHGNIVQITGTVQTGNTKYNFYLLDDNGQRMVGIHHYSTNFQNQITDSTQNVFLNLHGKKVTLTGIIYRFYTIENIWTLQCIGLEKELVVHDDSNDETNKVNIFAINDTHGAFVTDDGNVGLEKVQSVIKSIEDVNGSYIKIANGDIFQGTYISNINYGRPLVDALNAMNFNAFVIGNHEFDWGIEEISKYADGNLENGEANFPFLAANIVYETNKEKLPWTQDYVIVENNGYQVGIIGAIGQGLESSIASDKVDGYKFLDPVPIVSELSKLLRTQYNCDLVIVAIHEYNSYTNSRLSSLSGTSRIDGIVCGHTHQMIAEYEYREDGYQIPVLQSNTKNYTVGEMIIAIDSSNQAVRASIKHHNPTSYQDDPDISLIIDHYAENLASGNRQVGYTVEYLSRDKIGMEMIAAMQEKYGSDVAIINTGGVRTDIKPGIITVKDIYEVFPFDNLIIQTTISGYNLQSLINNHGSYLYFNDLVIDISKTYTLVTIDYVFTSTRYSQFSNSEPHYPNTLMRDVFIEYLESFYSNLS